MAIIDDFKLYTDQYGLVQPKQGESSGNGVLYTGEYVIALLINNALDAERSRLTDVFNSVQVQPGLIRRSPPGGAQWQDQEGPDDYIGAAAASYFLKTPVARQMLKYGRNSATKFLGVSIPYVYNNVNPGAFSFSAFMGLHQDLICHMQFAAGENPPLWRKLWWCISVMSATLAKDGSCDPWILSWMLIRTMDSRSWICRLAASYWSRKLLKMFPNGMSDVFAKYFNNADHPLARWVGSGI